MYGDEYLIQQGYLAEPTTGTGIYPGTGEREGMFYAVYEFESGGSTAMWKHSEAEAQEFITERVKNTENFWISRAANREPNSVVIDHYFWTIGQEPSPTALKTGRNHLGMGGRLFRIRRHGSDRVIETHNLWAGGQIPKEFWNLLPNDAEFVDGQKWVKIGDTCAIDASQ